MRWNSLWPKNLDSRRSGKMDFVISGFQKPFWPLFCNWIKSPDPHKILEWNKGRKGQKWKIHFSTFPWIQVFWWKWTASKYGFKSIIWIYPKTRHSSLEKNLEISWEVWVSKKSRDFLEETQSRLETSNNARFLKLFQAFFKAK